MPPSTMPSIMFEIAFGGVIDYTPENPAGFSPKDTQCRRRVAIRSPSWISIVEFDMINPGSEWSQDNGSGITIPGHTAITCRRA